MPEVTAPAEEVSPLSEEELVAPVAKQASPGIEDSGPSDEVATILEIASYGAEEEAPADEGEWLVGSR